MKTFFSQNRILIWIVIILLLINIITISSIFYYKSRQNNITTTNLPLPARDRRMMHGEGMFMRSFLDLDNEQFNRFRDARFAFHQKAQIIDMNIQKKRMELFEELKKPNSNPEKIRQISAEIGQLHTRLNLEMSNYYNQIKNICLPEQKERLYQFFMNTLEHEQRMPPINRGHMGGRRMQHRSDTN